VVVLLGGYFLQRARRLDTRPIATLSIYVLSPCLIFSSLVKSNLTATEVWDALAFVALLYGLTWIATKAVVVMSRLDRSQESVMFLSTLFVNSGNYGLPVVNFALGPEGLARAILFLVAHAFPTGSAAVYYASRGTRPASEALKSVVTTPMLYGPVFAILVRAFHIPLVNWEPVFAPIDMLGQAAIPVALFTLGMELANVQKQGVEKSELSLLAAAVLMRLVGGPLIAFLLVGVLGITGIMAKAMILEASMPTAVNTLLLVLTFGGRSKLQASSVFLSTVLSFISLSVILAILL